MWTTGFLLRPPVTSKPTNRLGRCKACSLPVAVLATGRISACPREGRSPSPPTAKVRAQVPSHGIDRPDQSSRPTDSKLSGKPEGTCPRVPWSRPKLQTSRSPHHGPSETRPLSGRQVQIPGQGQSPPRPDGSWREAQAPGPPRRRAPDRQGSRVTENFARHPMGHASERIPSVPCDRTRSPPLAPAGRTSRPGTKSHPKI